MPSRRTVVRTAAWTVPAVTVVGAAPAHAASPGATYQTINRSFTYDARLGGATGPVLGVINVAVEARVPLTAPVGETLDVTTTTSTVTIPSNLADLLKQVYLPGATQVDGTSFSSTALSGVITGDSDSNLVIPMTQLPADGQAMTTVASGSGVAPMTVPAGNPTGTVVMTMGEPSSQLVGYGADGTPTGGVYDSVLYKQAGTDYTLGTFEVIA